MSDEQNTTEDFPNSLDNETAGDVALQEGIAAIRKTHAIEREMLSRAIQSLCEITEKTPHEVIEILSTGLDEEYENAIKKAEASAKVVNLYVPSPRTLYTPPEIK